MDSITQTPAWQRLESRWSEGFDNLLDEEKQAIALWRLEAETLNGTLNQFFWNSAGDLALTARSALQSLGMPITLQALDEALAFFGPDYPVNRSDRVDQLKAIEARWGEDVFAPASRTIEALPEDFVQAAVDRLGHLYGLA